MKLELFGITCILLGASCLPASALPNLVTNPSFETGDFTGYTVVAGTTNVASAGGSGGYTPSDGTFYAALGNTGGDGTITQFNIPTQAGHTYNFSFDLASNGSTPNHFAAEIDGGAGFVSFFDQTDIPNSSGFQHFSSVFNPIGPSTLEFFQRDDPNFLGLDNISITDQAVSAVPEIDASSATAPLAMVFGSLALLSDRRRKKK